MKNKKTNSRFSQAIEEAVESFKLDLSGLKILTEASTGNYVVTPIIAALAGASVVSFSDDSKYGTMTQVMQQTNSLARYMGLENNISIIKKGSKIDLSDIDLVTNTGFVRPIDLELLNNLKSCSGISLMYEPWEFRETDIDLSTCSKKGIIVFGTDEKDERLKTIEYIGYIILSLLLRNNIVPVRPIKILLLGCLEFVEPTNKILNSSGYKVDTVTNYEKITEVSEYDSIIVLEHRDDRVVISSNRDSYIKSEDIAANAFVIHICGEVDFTGAKYNYIPKDPAPFGSMSFTTDFVDFRSLVNLHAAGLKVGEGIMNAIRMNLRGKSLVEFMTSNYPALPIINEQYSY